MHQSWGPGFHGFDRGGPDPKNPGMPKSRRAPAPRRSSSGARRGSPASDLPPLDSLVKPVLRGGREFLQLQDPLDAEGWASQVLGAWFKMPLPLPVRLQFEPKIRTEIVAAAERAGSAESLAVLRAFAAMDPDPIARPAAEAATRLGARGVSEPAWAQELRHPSEFLDASSLTDPYGDQDGYYL